MFYFICPFPGEFFHLHQLRQMQKAWCCRPRRLFPPGNGYAGTLTRTKSSIQMFLFQDTLLEGKTLAFWYFQIKQEGDTKNSIWDRGNLPNDLMRKAWPEDLRWLQAWLERLVIVASVDWINLDSLRGRDFLLDKFFRHQHLAQLFLPALLTNPWGQALEFVLSEAPQVGWLPYAKRLLTPPW